MDKEIWRLKIRGENLGCRKSESEGRFAKIVKESAKLEKNAIFAKNVFGFRAFGKKETASKAAERAFRLFVLANCDL